MEKRCGTLTESILGSIPHEVIFDIFIRLSIKDMLRCRCVSKSWFSLISDPQFIRYHLNNFASQRHITFSSDDTINTTSYQTLASQKLFLYQALPLPEIDEGEKVLFENRVPQHIDFLSSCEGLVLVGRGQRDHFLWNPSTRSCKQIPKIPFDFGSSYDHCIEDCIKMYGLGYDMSTDTYKVVRIVHILKPKLNRRLKFTARTYNCRTKCWKRISEFPYKIFRNAPGVVLNGVPHWIAARESNKLEFIIIYFDVVNDVIEEIETPLPCSLVADFRFSNLEGSLCLVSATESFSEVWKLQEDGSTKRWNKLFGIEKVQYSTTRPLFWFNMFADNFVPLCYTRDKEILFEVLYKNPRYFSPEMYSECTLKLLKYDLLSKEQHDILIVIDLLEDNVFNSATYIESLVSP